ncbi:MAG: outer membrane beta-barrel protein [Bacteroidales bacterium]
MKISQLTRPLFSPLILLLLSSGSVSSQDLVFHAGINVSGMNIRYYESLYNTSTYPILYPDLMISFDHRISDRFSVRPGVWYNLQGKRVVMDIGSGIYYEERFTINYLDLTFLATYHINPRKVNGYYIDLGFGPYTGYGFRGLVTGDNTAFVSEENLFLGQAEIRRTDFGYLFNIGFGFHDNQLSLFLSGGLKNLAIEGGTYTRFKRISSGVNYTRTIDFSPNARRLYKKRFLK